MKSWKHFGRKNANGQANKPGAVYICGTVPEHWWLYGHVFA